MKISLIHRMTAIILIILTFIVTISLMWAINSETDTRPIQGPGLGHHQDYAHFDEEGNFIGIKNYPQENHLDEKVWVDYDEYGNEKVVITRGDLLEEQSGRN